MGYSWDGVNGVMRYEIEEAIIKAKTVEDLKEVLKMILDELPTDSY